jgi:hypothetical protein
VANTFLKPTTIARAALGLLEREIVLPRLVTRLGLADFQGAANDTVNLRVQAILTAREYEWRTRNAEIVLDDVEELSVPVTLNKHPYSAVGVTDEELTLDITSFATQVLRPQVRAVAEKLEGYVATSMANATYQDTISFTNSTNSAWDVIVSARQKLNENNVPLAGRVLVLGSNVEAEFLRTDLFVKANESGSTSALRDATIGQLGGFTIVGGVNAINANAAYAFHPTAFVLANMAPAVPDGAVMGSSQSSDGLAMRWLRDYDARYLRDRSIVSAFAGTASVNDARDASGDLTSENARAVKITFYPNS